MVWESVNKGKLVHHVDWTQFQESDDDEEDEDEDDE